MESNQLDVPDAYIEHHKGGDNLSWDLPRYSSTPLYVAGKLLKLEESECNAWKTVAKLRHRVSELETQLAKNNPLLDEAADKIDALEAEHENIVLMQQAHIERLRNQLTELSGMCKGASYLDCDVIENLCDTSDIPTSASALQQHDAELVEKVADEASYDSDTHERIMRIADQIRKGEWK